jgi:hypothetical protein
MVIVVTMIVVWVIDIMVVVSKSQEFQHIRLLASALDLRRHKLSADLQLIACTSATSAYTFSMRCVTDKTIRIITVCGRLYLALAAVVVAA